MESIIEKKEINTNPYYVFHIIPRNSILRKIVDVCVLTRAYYQFTTSRIITSRGVTIVVE